MWNFCFKHLKSCHGFVNHSVPHVFPPWRCAWESHHCSLSWTLKAQWSGMSLLTRIVLYFILSIIYKFSNTFYTFKADVCDIWYWGFCIYFALCNPQYTIMSCVEHLTMLLFKFQSWKSMFGYCFLFPPTHNSCQCTFIRSACQKVWFNVHITDASAVKHLCQLCNACQHFSVLLR
jgi:hypothetical protein